MPHCDSQHQKVSYCSVFGDKIQNLLEIYTRDQIRNENFSTLSSVYFTS